MAAIEHFAAAKVRLPRNRIGGRIKWYQGTLCKMSDPITEELFRNAISAIGDEMVLTIYRTAYSGVLKNIMDYSAAICDAQGRLVAQGLSLPGPSVLDPGRVAGGAGAFRR